MSIIPEPCAEVLKSPVFFMLVSVMLYSMFPLVGVYGTVAVSGFVFAGVAHILSAAVSFGGAASIAAPDSDYRISRVALLFWQDKTALRHAVIAGVINYLSHAFLFVAFAFNSKLVATMIYEFWPVLSLFCLVFLSRKFETDGVRKDPEKLGGRVYFLSLVAFLGLLVIMFAGGLPDVQGSTIQFFGSIVWVGIILAAFSTVFMALSVVYSRNTRLFVEQHYKDCTTIKKQVHRALLASAATKIFGVLTFFVTLPFVPDGFLSLLRADLETWGWMFVNGVLIVTLGSLAYREALARTARVEITILWYTTPVFALLWFWLAGIESISPVILLGAVLIVSANALLNMKADTSPAFVGMFLSVSLTGLVVTLTEPMMLDGMTQGASLLDLVALPVGLIGILGGFLLQRISQQQAIAQYDCLHLIDHVAAQKQERSAAVVLELINSPANQPEELQKPIRRLRLTQSSVIRPGELLVMWVLGVFSILCITLFRTDSIIGTSLAVLTNASISYIVLHLSFDSRVKPEQVIATLANEKYGQDLHRQNIMSLVVIMLVCVSILFLDLPGLQHLGQ